LGYLISGSDQILLELKASASNQRADGQDVLNLHSAIANEVRPEETKKVRFQGFKRIDKHEGRFRHPLRVPNHVIVKLVRRIDHGIPRA